MLSLGTSLWLAAHVAVARDSFSDWNVNWSQRLKTKPKNEIFVPDTDPDDDDDDVSFQKQFCSTKTFFSPKTHFH